MLAIMDPSEAYRRSEVDARIAAARAGDLVVMCCEQVVDALSAAVRAHMREDGLARSKAMTRSLSAITVLEMGIDRSKPVAKALAEMYAYARQVVLGSVGRFNAEALKDLRDDFYDLLQGFSAPSGNNLRA